MKQATSAAFSRQESKPFKESTGFAQYSVG
jgi:hypothetical protein